MTTLTTEKLEIAEAVESREETFWKMSDAIWSYAELGLEEYKSSKLTADKLEALGFAVDRGVAGMPTALAASWSNGTGKPVIGMLGELDALPMLSQKSGVPKKEPVVSGAPGHGCSHHTSCPTQILAAVALKEIMEKKGLSGTLKVFGCPAEETLISRPYMVRAGLFNGVDVVIDCHGSYSLRVVKGIENNALYSFIVTFRGKTAHSGASPWMGRSAADAVELMHAATERMREHLPISQRTHWVTLEGGEAPNVVPDRASTWYYVRDVDDNVENIFKWALDCAKGAALMTQTTYEVKVLTAVHQRYHNSALVDLIFENMNAVGKPEYTEEEKAFARALQEAEGFPIKGMEYPVEMNKAEETIFMGGTSDVGDVTLVVPTACVKYPVQVPGSHVHHWSVVSSGATSIDHKGITVGAKVIACTVYDLLTKREVLAKVMADFEKLAKERPYKSFLPAEAQPPLGINKELMEKYRAAMEGFYINP